MQQARVWRERGRPVKASRLTLRTMPSNLLERWMVEQIGWRGLVRNVKREAPYWAATLPQLPRLLHRLLSEERMDKLERAFDALHSQGARRNRLLGACWPWRSFGLRSRPGWRSRSPELLSQEAHSRSRGANPARL